MFRQTHVALALLYTAAFSLPSLAAVEIAGVHGTMLGRDNGIVLVDIQTRVKNRIISKDTLNHYNGGYTDYMGAVRFSPDAQRIVFWANWWLSDWSAKAPGAMYVADNNGRNITKVCDAHVDHAELDYQSLSWCTDGYIYFARQTDTILRVDPAVGTVENYWSAVGVSGYKTDGVEYGPYVENLVVSRDGHWGVSSYGGKAHGLDLANRQFIRSCSGACRGTITTNGDQIVHPLTCCGYYPPGYNGDNAFLKVVALQSMDNCDDVEYMFAPGSADGPNAAALQYWMYRGACNSNDYLAGCGYGNDNGVLQNKYTSDYLVIPNYTCTDFYLGALPAPPSPTPRISLDSSSLTFVSTGGSTPAPKVVHVTNSGAGTLTNVAATDTSAWLTVSGSGSGNNQTLTTVVNIAGLPNGAYTTTVSVSGGGSSNTATYVVTLNVGSAIAAPTSLTASPGVAALSASLTWQDNAGNEAGYLVERQPSGGPWTQVKALPANAASWVDSSLTAGTYDYRVRAFAATDTSAWSNTAGVTIAAVISFSLTYPSVGQSLLAGAVETVRWTASNSTGAQIEWSADGGERWQVLSIDGAIRPADANWGAFEWAVPDTQSTACFVRVMEYSQHAIYDEIPFSVSRTSPVEPAALSRAVPRPQPSRLVDLRGRVVPSAPATAPTPKATSVKNCGTFGIVIGK